MAMQDGEVLDRAAIPMWVLPVLLVLCLAAFLAAAFYVNQGLQVTNATATQAAAKSTELAAQAVLTAEALETHSAQLTASFPTDTPEPTLTPTLTEVPTETQVPSATPSLTPTSTRAPTEIPTEGPTEAPQPTEIPGLDLLGVTWVLESYLANRDDPNLSAPLPNVAVDLIFSPDGIFSGNGGCNAYGGSYVTDGGDISFANISATQLLCDLPEGVMEQEAVYLELLSDAEEYRITEDGKLEIFRDDLENNQQVETVLLLFFPQSAVQ
jgi:hypothetical protein